MPAGEILRLVEEAQTAASPVPAGGAPVTVPAAAIIVAACDSGGRVLKADEGFLKGLDPEAVEAAVDLWSRGPRNLTLKPVAVQGGGASVVLIATPADALALDLSTAARQVATHPGVTAVVIGYRPFADPTLADLAAASWRLTPVESRIVLTLMRTGDLKSTADAVGASYQTVRKAFRSVLRKAGAKRQAELAPLLHAAVGGGHLQLDQASGVAAALDLSQRAADIAWLLAEGVTRTEAAAALGLSENAVKAELSDLFDRFDLRSATDLSRLFTEAAVLLGVARNPNARVAGAWSARRPLRFVHRPSGGRIALSDFGPASGEPTLLFHTSTTGAVLDRGLTRALQARGLRPIAVERPGFGLTDLPAASETDAALQDVLRVIDALGLRQVRILARGGEYVALDLAKTHADRVRRGVLLNPFTPQEMDRPQTGILNQLKRALMSRPSLVAPLARLLARRATPAVIEQFARRAVGGSPTDLAALDRPEIMEDYVESVRIAQIQGGVGFIYDQRRTHAWRPPELDDGSAWTRILGVQDVLHRPTYDDAFWELTLPGHRCVRIVDGGRFIHATHPETIAEELAR